jgi:hypothetical protein
MGGCEYLHIELENPNVLAGSEITGLAHLLVA